MTRRSGLGRGLAALIPPSDPSRDRTDDEPPVDPATDAADGDAVPPDPPPDSSDEPGDDAGSGHADPSAVGAPPPPPPAPSTVDRPAGQDASAGYPTADVPAVTSAAPGVAPRATLAEVSPSDIVANPRQPREVFDEEEIEGLAVSLLDVGVLQPLVVRPLEGGRYELVAGERRLRAAKVAGLELIPVVVRHTEDADLLKEALVENIHRVQLNPLEEAAAYQQLLEEFGFTQEELASRIGKSRPAISNSLRLLSLPTGVQRRVAANVLSAGHAKALLALPDPVAQERLAERVVAEGLSVRAVEEFVRVKLLDESGAGGGASGSSSGGGKRRVVAPGLIDLQDDLSDALESRVRITMGARRGKLTIEFASVDDLERIVGVIAGGLESGSGSITVPSDEL